MTYNPETKKGTKPNGVKPKKKRPPIDIIQLSAIRTDLALLRQLVNQIMNNDLPHIQNELNQIRTWGLAFFSAVLIAVLTLHLEKLLN
jgi:hypothetical protein